jgi:hypothetical protein
MRCGPAGKKAAAPSDRVRLLEKPPYHERSNVVARFIQRHRDLVIGQLNGWDRLRFRGSKRLLCTLGGMLNYLWQMRVLNKEFKDYALALTEQLRQATVRVAEAIGQQVRYLASSSLDKEQEARSIARQRGVSEGLIAIFSATEPCLSYHLHRNRQTRTLDLDLVPSKCLHYYHYYQHPRLGFLHVRLQTWFPFTIHICINGREWLARQMDAAGLGYRRMENCFVELADPAQAQKLMDQQLQTDWPRLLDELAGLANPVHEAMFPKVQVPYYWSAQESEWASDVMFRSAEALAPLYARRIHHGLTTLGSADVMRFLGSKLPAHGGVNASFKGQLVSDLKRRPEGIRIKHRRDRNSIKMYNKQASVLRVETTINEPRDFKAFRPKEGDPEGPKQWRYLRRGVADLHRRAQVSQAANDRYLESMAAVEQPEPLGQLFEPLCRPVRRKNQKARALNPLSADDRALLAAVSRGEFLLHGFRNRDLRTLLYGHPPTDQQTRRRQAGVVTRKLRLLKMHGLIHKVSHTHRWMLSANGHRAITALLAAAQADTAKLLTAA